MRSELDEVFGTVVENVFEKIWNFFIFLFQINMFFYVFISFWCTNIENNF
jgi:hypothetical protein